ncbi:MAG: glutamate--cysteine ligase [Proteobacteria bacterium]|nr:glutamate--cysteine ligase [Pseudomonadota bacterium]
MIETLEQFNLFARQQRTTVEHWLGQQWRGHPAPFYGSFDIRESGFKLACIDANLFPAGFNNIHSDCHTLIQQKLKDAAAELCVDINGILLVAEKIDHNPFYFDHLQSLSRLLGEAGIPARICRSDIADGQPQTGITSTGEELSLHSLDKRGGRLWSGSWSPCAVLLNDDLTRASASDIALYKDIEQTILPVPELGWYQRKKSDHFRHYSEITSAFCQEFSIDNWLLDPLFQVCSRVDIGSRVGLDCIATHCQTLLAHIAQSYSQRGIKDRPSCFVKSDSGTYGLGVIHIDDPEQIFSLNRKQRKAMSYDKSGSSVEQVIIQECVPSRQLSSQAEVAEHVFYTVHHRVVGGFIRSHPGKSAYQSLNSPGMSFTPVSLQEIDSDLYHFQVVAMLSLLAAAREEIDKTEDIQGSARRPSNPHRPSDDAPAPTSIRTADGRPAGL